MVTPRSWTPIAQCSSIVLVKSGIWLAIATDLAIESLPEGGASGISYGMTPYSNLHKTCLEKEVYQISLTQVGAC